MEKVVSFCVKSYNQRRYVLAALEGALAQTYRPLEIVVSDDCSTDGSWEAIQERIASFRQSASPDRLEGLTFVLNRNPVNRGNLGNWEKICEIATGELLVKADGDDVSLPDRTLRIVSAWLADGARAFAVCHSGWQIGPRDESYGRLRQVTSGWPLGAAMAYSPELFRRFPKVAAEHERRMDDVIYTWRALMSGTVLEIPDRLVRYRIGTGISTSFWHIRDQMRLCSRDSLSALEVSGRDAASLPVSQRDEWLRRIDTERRRLSHQLALLDEKRWTKRIRLARLLGKPRFFSIANYFRISFLLPRCAGDAMLFAYVLARNAYWRLTGLSMAECRKDVQSVEDRGIRRLPERESRATSRRLADGHWWFTIKS